MLELLICRITFNTISHLVYGDAWRERLSGLEYRIYTGEEVPILNIDLLS